MVKKKAVGFGKSAEQKPAKKKLNPFEVHLNRRKYDILGTKSKAERGLPGISRTRSLKKRKRTLLQEYKMKDKKNLFLDKRIGENNKAMTAEDRIIARYTAERMKSHSRKSIYNLGDEEELTHKGQTLTELEKFDNPVSDEELDEEEGRLSSGFVKDAHFGGDIFKKVDGEPKSRRDLIDQLIAESIKRKAEKQKVRQTTLDMTEKLDTDWRELLPIVTAAKKSKLEPEPSNKNEDKFADYDVLSKKLKFEARGKPSDRLKSEEEIAKEEKEKLETLENKRIQRMQAESINTVKHRSADDMDDGFYLNNESVQTLSYTNGEETKEDNDSGSDSNSDCNNSAEENKKFKDAKTEYCDHQTADDEDGNSDNYENEKSDIDESDDYSDLKETDESDAESVNVTGNSKQNEQSKACEKKRKDVVNEKQINQKNMEIINKELPYTFDIPNVYEDFEKLLASYNSDHHAIIVERMIKCNNPSLKTENKEKLDMLFTFLLQHIQDCATDDSMQLNCFKTLDKLAPFFFDLTQWNPQSSLLGLMEVIKEKYKDFQNNSKSYPSLDTLIFLKLVSILFPTSDYRHSVVTPSLIFMQEILFKCHIQSSVDVSCGLFIATLILEYCMLSRRYVPEVFHFLYCILRLAHPKDSQIRIELPLQHKTFDSFNLNIVDPKKNIECNKLTVSDLINANSSEQFKTNALYLALNLLSKFCDFWSEGQYAIFVFQPFISLLDTNRFSDCLKKSVEDVLNKILKFKSESLKMLVLQKRKPKPLRLYEPNIEETCSFKRHVSMSKKKAERAKLLHKYKREMKGALREIRRDRSFLCKLKYRETIQSDQERNRKVQDILSSAAQQQGELRKIQRKK